MVSAAVYLITLFLFIPILFYHHLVGLEEQDFQHDEVSVLSPIGACSLSGLL